jgi:hypothetical protein
MQNQELEFIVENKSPVQFQEVEKSTSDLPRYYRDRVSVDVIHDGAYIPEQFLCNDQNQVFNKKLIQKYFVQERDWGANFVATRLAEKLGLNGYLTVNTARCLMDFGRFPGSTKEGATHLGRFAINYPFSDLLNLQQKRSLLESHYDYISDTMDEYLQGKILKIAIHTYDQYNASGTERPQVSLVTRMLGYQLESRMPIGVFDPIFPDILAEFTVDRVLRDRISLTLEKSNIPVAHNYPYLLPEGSIEVRHQVWRFFEWLHHRFIEVNPKTARNDSFNIVWRMLKDTNLRSAEAGALRSVVHMYRRPTNKDALMYEQAMEAYKQIYNFVQHPEKNIIREYRLDPLRCMSLGIEVRKDLVWKFDKNGNPIEPNLDQANIIADKIAEAISVYFNTDRMEMNKLPKIS